MKVAIISSQQPPQFQVDKICQFIGSDISWIQSNGKSKLFNSANSWYKGHGQACMVFAYGTFPFTHCSFLNGNKKSAEMSAKSKWYYFPKNPQEGINRLDVEYLRTHRSVPDHWGTRFADSILSSLTEDPVVFSNLLKEIDFASVPDSMRIPEWEMTEGVGYRVTESIKKFKLKQCSKCKSDAAMMNAQGVETVRAKVEYYSDRMLKRIKSQGLFIKLTAATLGHRRTGELAKKIIEEACKKVEQDVRSNRTSIES